MRQKKNGFAPRLEVLEDRRCPSVSSVQDHGMLQVTGTGNDTFTVSAIGDRAYSVTSGTTTTQFTDVRQLNINLGSGVNNLTLNIDPRIVDHNANIRIRGNSATTGTDNVNVNLGTGVKGGENVNLHVDLGNGTNNFTLGGSLAAAKAATLTDRSHLNLHYNGGSGVDKVILNFWNLNKRANADLHVNLGAGNDSFAMNMPTSPGNGIFDDRAFINLHVDGGSGNDTATFTGRSFGRSANLHVQNVENGNLALFSNDHGDNNNNDDDNNNDNNDDHGDNNND
jgi:hypothetical protein